jgi:hypothetical protein
LGREIIRLGGGEKKSSAKEISGLQNKIEEKSYSLEATNAILRKNQKREKKNHRSYSARIHTHTHTCLAMDEV